MKNNFNRSWAEVTSDGSGEVNAIWLPGKIVIPLEVFLAFVSSFLSMSTSILDVALILIY